MSLTLGLQCKVSNFANLVAIWVATILIAVYLKMVATILIDLQHILAFIFSKK